MEFRNEKCRWFLGGQELDANEWIPLSEQDN